jgi:hypothetical protein
VSAPMTERGPSTVGARLTSCPGCGEIEGVEQTSCTPRVAAWKCNTCGMSWAISPVNHGQRPAYFELLAATVEQLGATRSVLRAVVTLADDAPTITDQQLRDRLLALAERARLAQRAIVQDSGGVTVPR